MSDDIFDGIRNAIGGMDEGACFGNYEEQSSDCRECGILRWCEPATRRIHSGQVSNTPSESSSSDLSDVDPWEYLLDTLKGKYTMTVGTKGDVKTHYLKEDEEARLMVAISKTTGAMLFRTGAMKMEVKSLTSVGQVEEILTVLGV